MTLKLVKINKKKIYLLGVIKGLTSERALVRKAFKKFKPDAIAVYPSEAQILGLQSVVDGKTKQVPLSRYEVIYARKLAYIAQQNPDKYGEVQVPPPALVEAMELGNENKVPVVALDMGDEAYAHAFVKNVSTIHLIRHSMRIKKLSKKKFTAKTPKEFTYAWDKELTKLKGFRNLETAREQYMAKRLLELKEKFSCILAILELERIEGVLRVLKDED